MNLVNAIMGSCLFCTIDSVVATDFLLKFNTLNMFAPLFLNLILLGLVVGLCF